MCGRFTYRYQWRQLAEMLRLIYWPGVELTPRFNVAPTQDAPVIRLAADGTREGVMLRWGLVPSWADDPSVGGRNINARAETIAEKPTYRQAFAARRCLVPVSGFYEWRTLADGKTKQPYWIGRHDGEPFWLAGVWEQSGVGGQTLESFSILTTSPNDFMRALHDRMPVLVAPTDVETWLAATPLNPPERERLLAPSPMLDFEMFPVSRRVSSPQAEGPELIARVEVPPDFQGFLF
ncbi:MAG: SOS response-associated peptidase [Phycisphaerales bacterium]|jgi:putative SOS response-associated peptidase YedK